MRERRPLLLMRKALTRRLMLVLSLLIATNGVKGEKPRLTILEPSFHFEIVGLNSPVEHTFHFVNAGETALRVTKVTVTSPMVFKSADSIIPPGKQGAVSFSLGTPRIAGPYEGEVQLDFDDPHLAPLVFDVTGKIIPAIECLPMPAFFVSTQRGHPKSVFLELINHEKEPLKLSLLEYNSKRFHLELKTLEEGMRFQLTLHLSGQGVPGRATDSITLTTSSQTQPRLTLLANTLIKERVYTFPDRLDFGAIQIAELRATPELTNYLSQTLMIYRESGVGDFQVTAETDVPFLKLSIEPSETKDRFKIIADVLLEKLKPGFVQGHLALKTNDREFPSLQVPVSALVQDSTRTNTPEVHEN